jgi:CHAT domain-containing protein
MTAWNDLSAAYLTRATETGNITFAIDALAAADHALTIESHYEPALFNRALVLERLGLHALSRRAWISYLREERNPLWSDEALGHIAAISASNGDVEWRQLFRRLQSKRAAELEKAVAEAVNAYPQYARRWGENVVLGDWAEATKRGDQPAAAKHLNLARQIGLAVGQSTGDQMLRQIVAGIDIAVRDHREDPLAAAILQYRQGRLAHSANRPSEAERTLRNAEELLAHCGSPLALTARYYVASTLNAQWRIDAAATLLDDLARLPLQASGYHALAAQIGWERGSSYVRSGAMSNAVEAFDRSRDAFAQLRETDFAATMDASSAVVFDLAGDSKSAWSARVRALDQLSRSGNTARILVVLEEAAQSAAARHEWDRAEALKMLTCTLAEQVGNAAVSAYAWSSRAVVASERGDFETARLSIASARKWVGRLTDHHTRTRADADLAFAEGAFLQRASPAESCRKYDDALKLYADAQSLTEMPSIYLARARVRKRLLLLADAENDVQTGLRIVRQERGGLREPEKRETLVESSNALFDEAIDLALRTGKHDRAFELADEQRARSLSDRFVLGTASLAREAPLLSIAVIRERLAPDAAIVEYASLPDRLVTFVVRRNALHVIATAIPRGRIVSLFTDLRRAVRRDDRASLKTCSSAYDAVFAVVQPHLNGIRNLAIVGDDRIGEAPFGAMFDSKRGEFVIERMNLTLAPSATLLIEASQRWLDGADDRSLLAVGAGVFDRNRFPDAEPLLAAKHEASRVASFYRDKAVLLDADATKSTTALAIRSHAIFHFAGHAVIVGNGSGAVEPALLVAPANGDDGDLRASDIAGTRLDRTRLVILAACRSATAPQRNDGNGSLALSFFAAGVPAVVATLADLPDSDSGRVMAAFHGRVARGDDPVTALGDAVRHEIRDERGLIRFPLAWANLVSIGGSGEFIARR